MASIVITGATGTIGSATLTTALASPSISAVTVLARRAPNVSHPKLETILLPSDTYPDGFEALPESLINRLAEKKVSGVIWALGISQTQVKEPEYIKITHDYPLVAARAFKSLVIPEKPFRFVYVSGMGADQGEKGWTLFGRVKGRTEKALVAQHGDGFEVVNIRPGGVIPTEDRAPDVPFMTRIAVKVFGMIAPSMMITSTQVGEAAVGLVTGKGWEKVDSQSVIENGGLLKLAAAYRSDMGISS